MEAHTAEYLVEGKHLLQRREEGGMVRHHSAEGVELNVTAMLDMAFQLLAFFIGKTRAARNG